MSVKKLFLVSHLDSFKKRFLYSMLPKPSHSRTSGLFYILSNAYFLYYSFGAHFISRLKCLGKLLNLPHCSIFFMFFYLSYIRRYGTKSDEMSIFHRSMNIFLHLLQDHKCFRIDTTHFNFCL